jgi:hypothetical protein
MRKSTWLKMPKAERHMRHANMRAADTASSVHMQPLLKQKG